MGTFYKLRNKLSSGILQSIYLAFVHLHVFYGIEVHANTYRLYLHKLETLNNKLLRTLQNKPHNSPSNDLYIDYNTLSITNLYIGLHQILLFVHKFMYHKHRLPGIFGNYFRLNNTVYDHLTRGSNDRHVRTTAVNNNYMVEV